MLHKELKKCNMLYAFKAQLLRCKLRKSNAKRQAIDLFHAFQRLYSFALRFYEIETLLPQYDVSRLRIILRKLLYFTFPITTELTKKRNNQTRNSKR